MSSIVILAYMHPPKQPPVSHELFLLEKATLEIASRQNQDYQVEQGSTKQPCSPMTAAMH